MSFQIQITVDSIEEAERVLARVGQGNPPPTFDDAKAALQALLARHDGDMTVPLQVLASYDAQRVSAVKEADWPAFIAACAAA